MSSIAKWKDTHLVSTRYVRARNCVIIQDIFHNNPTKLILL